MHDSLQIHLWRLAVHISRILLLTQVFRDATPMHCRTDQGKVASQLFGAFLLNRLTACSCHCRYTYGDVLLTQVFSDAKPMHCSLVRAKQLPTAQRFSAKQADSMLASLQIHLWRFAVDTGFQ